MAIIIILVWCRFFLTVSNTMIAGPTLRILGAMITQLAQFVLIWLGVVLFFSTLGQIWFGQLMQFRTISASFETLLYSVFGAFDKTWFETLGNRRVYGIYFLMVYLVTNVLLLTNYVVAIMTDKYAMLQESRLGLFYDGLVGSMADYKYDSRYGFLIANMVPFNIFGFILSPIFFVIKNEAVLKRINYFLTMFSYLPIALIATIIFLAANIFFAPFAYVIGVAKKIQLLNCNKSLGDLITFIFLG